MKHNEKKKKKKKRDGTPNTNLTGNRVMEKQSDVLALAVSGTIRCTAKLALQISRENFNLYSTS
jgi:hypothetical protein